MVQIMSDPSVALQTALIAAIEGVVDCDVWDAVPQNSPYPYVTIDSSVAGNEDFLAERMDRRFIYIGVWSRNYGQAEVSLIMSQIDTLNEKPLSLSTGQVASLRVERKRTVREPDNLTYQGQVTLRIITTH